VPEATVAASANRTEIVPTGMLSTLVRWYLRSGLRGSTRCTFAVARHLKALHAVPIVVNQRQQLWIDLRDGLSHLLLAGSPWATVPWESDEQALMRRLVRPSDVVFDVGAHIGLHTVLLSEIVARNGVVHAFEPNAGKATALARTIAALPNAHLHPFALGEVEGCVALYIPEDESMASLADWTYGREWHRRRATCEVKRVDDLVACGELPTPDFVKCDVEGAELAVLRGGTAVFDRAEAPIVLYEVNQWAAHCFGLAMSAATDFLRGLSRAKYSIFYAQDNGRVLTPYDNPELGDCFNLIAIPAGRMDRLRQSAFDRAR
jgi:FkbM family methyltransferase